MRDLAFGYGRGRGGDGFRLRVPELTIAAGEAVAFVGPSGCGKTTLVHLIAGVLRPDAGEIAVDGRSLSGLGERELREHRIARIGFVFQRFELLDYLDARENILLPNLVGGGALPPARAKRDAVARLAASVGLAERLLGRRPAQLSQGERQRVAICRALLNEPEILIADEPTGSLDPDTTAAIMDVIWEQVRARPGRTFLMVTHDRSLLDPFDRVVDCRELGGAGGAPRPAGT